MTLEGGDRTTMDINNGGFSNKRLARARDKIKTIDELAEVAAQTRAAGGTVVMAHGVFDLIHMGHVRHLEEARRHGTELIVTITPDRFVNKGPGRPVFTELLRAEMLGALAYVDWIGINTGPTAEPALAAIKPDVYVKGNDYANPKDDFTGRIDMECKVVEKNGGRVVFTDELTFSSSALINQHLNPFDPEVQPFLNTMRDRNELEAILELVDRVKDSRVLIVGDTIIDEYRYVVPMSKTPKENLIAMRFESNELFAGGVIATANHVAGFCRDVEVVTVLGGENNYADFVQATLKPNVRLRALYRDKGPTILKSRFIDPSHTRKLFEVYVMDDSPVSEELQTELNGIIGEIAGDFDAVIVNDFGHGMIMPSTIETLMTCAGFLAVNAQTNSANVGFNLITKYSKAHYICIDEPEARLAVGDKLNPLDEIIQDKLARVVTCPTIIVTRGYHGCVAYTKDEPIFPVPAFADKVVDTVGAGDAFFAIIAPLLAADGALRHVAFIGNVAGALKVSIIGHRESIDKISLVKAITALLK